MNTTAHPWGDDRPDSRMELLEQIDRCGSINRAAAALGLSYKAAWTRLDSLGNLAPEPLVARATGGAGGGGTRLTAAGHTLLDQYRAYRREYRQFLQLSDTPAAAASYQNLRRLTRRFSARNVWAGTVAQVEPGAVNSLVRIALRGGDRLTAAVTCDSVAELGLAPGRPVIALAAASAVMLARDLGAGQVSARNRLAGTICRILPGAVQAEVTIELAGGNTVSATITLDSLEQMGLAEGQGACALLKASSILLAVD